MTRTHHIFMSMALAIGLASGCDRPTQGVAGNLDFTPIDCGRYTGCSFADSLGLGGATNVYITGIGSFNATGVTLESSDPEILIVNSLGDVAGRPTWELLGAGAGTARLIAAKDRTAVDSIEVKVQPVSELSVQKIIGDVTGPLYDADGYDQRWIASAGERAVLHVTPMVDGEPIMGRYQYAAVFADAGFEDHVNDLAILSRGELDFTAPAGQYGLTFADDHGNSISVLVDVQPDAL